MFKRTFQLLVVACVVASALWAADAAFVGEWKLNPSKSKLTDQMKVESLGANKYAFDFEGDGNAETIVADGTDQPGVFGTTLSVTVEGSDALKVVRNGPYDHHGELEAFQRRQYAQGRLHRRQSQWVDVQPELCVQANGSGIRFRGHLAKHERDGELGLCASGPALRGGWAFLHQSF